MRDILTYPQISISIINLNGKDYLGQCLDSIKKLDYPEDKLETIVIDNGSSDDSVNFIKSNYPLVKLISNDKNMGFAFANNQAAKAANGDYIAFLNNDTRVDKNWLIELLRPIYKNKEVVASGSKVLSIDGKNIDFVGGMINFEGKGFQIDYGIPVEKGNYSQYRYLPFVNGGAMLVDRKIFLGAGGFDEDFFAYYEDVDFGWRARLSRNNIVVTHWLNKSYYINMDSKDNIVITGKMSAHSWMKPSPAKHIILRSVSYFFGNHLIPWLKKLMIFGDKEIDVSFTRQVIIHDHNIEIEDDFTGKALSNIQLYRAPHYSLRHVSSAGLYVPEELLLIEETEAVKEKDKIHFKRIINL